jgi:hypothetical protein
VAVLLLQGKLWTARILSRPAFTGQVTAASDRVSFSVTSRAQSGLGPLTEAPAAFSAFFAANAGAAVPGAAQALVGRANRLAAASSTAQLRKALTLAGIALAVPAAAALLGGTAVTAATVGMAAAGIGIISIARVPTFQLDAWDRLDQAFASSTRTARRWTGRRPTRGSRCSTTWWRRGATRPGGSAS